MFYKNDALDDPLVNDDTACLLADLSALELREIKDQARQINTALKTLFNEIHIDLIDFKVEFGKDQDGTLILSDEVSPDTCRLTDQTSFQSLDKDVFRRQSGDLLTVYQDVLTRLEERK